MFSNLKNKINWRRIVYTFLWVVYAAGLLFVLGFVEKKQDEVICRELKIEIDRNEEHYFIEADEVREILRNTGEGIVKLPVAEIRVDTLERVLRRNPYVQDAQVYTDLLGTLRVEIRQRRPLLRLINSSYRSFYVDDQGRKMPLSPNYTARVLIANGNISERYGGIIDTLQTQTAKNLFTLARFILEDEFWTAQIEQVYVDDSNDLVLIPRVGNHKIILGDITDLEEKFDNLMTFYQKALPRVGWNAYSAISIKFKNQIVCTKQWQWQ